ncbi:acetoacetate decarboxylase [Aspergillus pseudoustus]|uniref:Acetoacetate decarboxylase n=1 Tax=Aspergillus pseudoustus TaxID=1810923 RepID=A0ABR4IMW7_9EURO
MYQTSAESIKHLIPSDFELDDEPVVTVVAVHWGFSPYGPYTEWIQTVEVTYRGVKYDFSTDLILDNEAAIFIGREQLGVPKVFGKVVFPSTVPVSYPAGLERHVERPVGRPIIRFAFKPETKVQESGPVASSSKMMISLRVIPSPFEGQDASIREYLVSKRTVTDAEVWTGAGSIVFAPQTNFNVSHQLPIVRYLDARLLRNASSSVSTGQAVFAV